MALRQSQLPWIWGLLTAALLAAVLVAAAAQRHAERAQWEAEVRVASLRPQQFFLNWLELRRQLLRGLVLRSRGQGWNDQQAFEMDVVAVRGDIDGDISLPVLVASVRPDGSLRPIGRHEVDLSDWLTLQRRPAPSGFREALLPPLGDGRVPLAQNVAGDQWIWLLLEIPELLEQLHALDWPRGLSLRLELLGEGGQPQAVWRSPAVGAARFSFAVEEVGPAGSWRLHWSTADRPTGGLSIWIGCLGSLFVLTASAAGWVLVRSRQRLHESLQQLEAAHIALRQGLAERSAALERSANQHQLALSKLTEAQLDWSMQALRRWSHPGASIDAPLATAPMRRERFSLRQLIEELLAEVAPTLRAASCLIEYQPGPALQMEGYPVMLQALLRLCIDRAVMQGLLAQPAPELELSFQSSDTTRVHIQLRDNGEPLSSEALLAFFAPPGQTATSWLGGYLLHLLISGPLGGRCSLHHDGALHNVLTLDLPLVAPPQDAS